MKVKVFEDVNNFYEMDLKISCVREIISGVKLHKGAEEAKKLAEGKYKYILIPENDEEKPVALIPEVIMSDVSGFKELLVIKDIEGEVKAAMIAPLIAGAGATMATVTAVQAVLIYTVTAIINIAISIALNMIMSLISPTKEFSSDPASAQRNNSNLFNGAPLIREQGGSVPLAFGYGFAGGVLISSSLTTSEG